MLISEFAIRTGLSRETVRFYVRLGLLNPQTTLKGGRNPYQLFRPEHVAIAELIRIGQAWAFTQGNLCVDGETTRRQLPLKGRIEMMRAQLVQLDRKAE